MLVSIYSLRRHYDGPVLVLIEGKQDEWFLDKLKMFNCKTKEIPFSGEYPLSIKPTLWRYVDHYSLVMFLDADTLVVGPLDEYWDLIWKHGFVTGNFANWKTRGSSIAKRIKNWKPAVPEMVEPALNYGTAVNTGINGWKKDHPTLKEWERVCALGYAKKCTNRIVDEIACQMILPHSEHGLAGVEWGTSVKFGTVDNNTKIIHYHGHKHVGNYPNCEHWKSAYLNMRTQGFIEDTHKAFYDKSVAKWINCEGEESVMACTLVTAVNKSYLEKFKKNYPLWMKTKYIGQLPMMIFVHDDCWHDEVWEKIVKEGNNDITLRPWAFPKAATSREEMISAFVFGVGVFVKTKYWIKLDCDCTPKSENLHIPPEAWRSTLTAKAWGYTKVKGDPQFEEDGIHWLKRLDEWANALPDFKDTEPLFADVEIEGARHGHKRICTFFAIEKTAWTKHLLDMCMRSEIRPGMLPVPSQDTTTWYAITRLGGKRNVHTYDFRKYWQP